MKDQPIISSAGITRRAKNIDRALILDTIRSVRLTRAELAKRLGVEKENAAELLQPLLDTGVVKERSETRPGTTKASRVLSMADPDIYFVGVNIGARQLQIGSSLLSGEIEEDHVVETPPEPDEALEIAREQIAAIIERNSGRRLAAIGVSVPGMTDAKRSTLQYAPNLGWKNVPVANKLAAGEDVKVIVDNDAKAAALFESRVLRHRAAEPDLFPNFILIRSGTGIGVGLVIAGEVFRGSGMNFAGEFGHMTIVAGGKTCVCGNRGCWERYGSASSASSLYLGDRPPGRGESVPRFVDIVNKASNGENRARRTLEKIGDYLGIGIANVVMGVGIPRVIISGRMVYGWDHIRQPVYDAIRRSIVGQLEDWSVEAGAQAGSELGGALEIAINEYLCEL